MKYVAYYRVSTAKQGQSGLGLEAQKVTVKGYVGQNEIVGEFIEVESGKKDNRVELGKAIDFAKKENATLVIAKLDRLSRNLTFISSLMDNKIKFVCCDMPEANETTIGIMAVLAQQERKLISSRTKAALAVIKETKGVIHHKKGTAKTMTTEKRNHAIVGRKEKSANVSHNKIAKELIELYLEKGLKPAQILVRLQEKGVKTGEGNTFKQVVQVTRLIKIMEREKSELTKD